ncbi:MAG TPA: helix-turn-helix domain-containing protein [Acidimicrobiales bacterium]|nr:helix-turn-helix domain-containing protein [Acidimicrobiales bacterium]
MARVAAPDRVGGIVDAALEVFGRLGYSRAQMADVAEAAGVSVGTLYNYVEGKEALLLLCALYAFDPDAATRGPKPLTVASRPRFLVQLRQSLEALTQLPALDAALARKRAPADVVGECARIVEELFDLVGDNRRGLDALERCARDAPDLAALFYDSVRQDLLRDLTAYVTRRARQLDAAVTARWIVESVTWMARHRFGDPDGGALDAEAVRATTVRLITRAITGGTA